MGFAAKIGGNLANHRGGASGISGASAIECFGTCLLLYIEFYLNDVLSRKNDGNYTIIISPLNFP